MFAHGVLPRPEFFHGPLIQNHDRAGLRNVGCGKCTAAQQGHAHRAKILRIHRVYADHEALAGRQRLAFNATGFGGDIGALERQVTRNRDSFHAGQRLQPGKQLIHEMPRLILLGIFGAGEVDRHGHQMIGIEARLHVQQADKAPG